MTQLTLLDDPLEVAFQQWVRANPDVIEAIRQLALGWRRAGHDRCGISMLAEVARWQHGIRQQDEGDGLAINNSYRSRLARLLMATTPELPADFFSCRALANERAAA